MGPVVGAGVQGLVLRRGNEVTGRTKLRPAHPANVHRSVGRERRTRLGSIILYFLYKLKCLRSVVASSLLETIVAALLRRMACMIDKALLDEVRTFMDRYRDAYIKLLNSLRSYATSAGDRLGKDVVRGIYSRGSKQGGHELKLPARIAEKLGRKRSDGVFRIHEMNDIVGLTVTVAYHEDIDRFIEALRATLPDSIIITNIETKSARGYYAAHLDCKSNSGAQAGLVCEIQVKTALHDLWGSKTHDLTYKPGGTLDVRLESLMTIAGDMLQAVELQSSVIRRLILAEDHVERETRQAARKRVMDVEFVRCKRKGAQHLIEFTKLLSVHEHHIATCNEDDPILEDIVGVMSQLCLDSIDIGWIAAFDLASKRSSDRILQLATQNIAMLADNILQLEALDDSELDNLVLCGMALYALGNIDAAIEVFYRSCEVKQLPHKYRIMLTHNLADCLVEREYYNPTKDLKRRCHQKQIIESLYHEGASGDREIDDSSRGFFTLTFSEDPKEIREAIDLCQSALQYATEEEVDVATTYCELYVRLGWRKLFRIMQAQ